LVFPEKKADDYLKANNAIARMSVGRPFVAVARINGPRDPGVTRLKRQHGEHSQWTRWH
jgi:hypothetical protein